MKKVLSVLALGMMVALPTVSFAGGKQKAKKPQVVDMKKQNFGSQNPGGNGGNYSVKGFNNLHFENQR